MTKTQGGKTPGVWRTLPEYQRFYSYLVKNGYPQNTAGIYAAAQYKAEFCNIRDLATSKAAKYHWDKFVMQTPDAPPPCFAVAGRRLHAA